MDHLTRNILRISHSALSEGWSDPLNIPAFTAIASACIFVLTLSMAHTDVRKSPEDDHNREYPMVVRYIQRHGGKTIVVFKIIRLLCVLGLVGLAAYQLVLGLPTEADQFTWLAIRLTSAYAYAFFLALLTMATRAQLSSVASHHLTVLLLITWGLYVYRDVWPLATFTLTPQDRAEGGILWAKMALLSMSGVLVPLCIPRIYVPVDPEEPMIPHPEQTASMLSLVLYGWMDETVWKAYRRPHTKLEDFPPLADYDHTKNLVKRSFPHLDPFQTPKRRHFFWGLMRVFRKDYAILGLMLASRSAAYLASPIGVNRLLNYLEQGGEGLTVRPWVWILFLFLGPTVGTFAFQWYVYTVTRVTVRAKAIITQLIFEHALRIRVKAETAETKSAPATPGKTPDTASLAELPSASAGCVSGSAADVDGEEATFHVSGAAAKDEASLSSQQSAGGASNLVGRINNLVTTDMQTIDQGRDFIFVVVEVPTRFVLCTWFLYSVLGWSAFVGMALMGVLLPIPGYIASFIHGLQEKKMAKTDARVQTVTEFLGVVRMIKLFGWEPRVAGQVAEKREDELGLIRRLRMRVFLMDYMNHLIPLVTMIVTYAVYTIVMKQTLTASVVFSSMTLFETLRFEIMQTFWMIPSIIQAKVSLDRVDKFLNETELLDEFSASSSDAVTSIGSGPADSDVIGFCNAAFTWTASEEGNMTPTPSRRVFRLLIEDELTFKRGKINLILGPTGSGKTSMLMALLGEMHYIPNGPDSYVNLPRSVGVAYAAQESWVQNETIKDNILFGSPYDEERYNKVIDQCGLKQDLDLLDAGDLTEVGEKGLTLSGGQKARITLARAIYSPAEILLLDDVLAALDVHTSQWIVSKCFTGDLVRDRTLILVTHNVAISQPIADFVVSLGTDGRVHSQGSLASALEADEELASELTEQAKEDRKAEDDINGPETDTAGRERKGKLIVEEEVSLGHVGWSAFKLFLGALGGHHPLTFWITCLSTYFLCEVTSTIQVWFLGLWTRQYEVKRPEEIPVAFYVSTYALIQGVTVILFSISYIIYILGTLRASRVIHSSLVSSILGTTLRWLDMTPASRIITRCTQDIQAIDSTLVDYFFWWTEHSGTMVTRLGAVVIMSPLMLIPGSTIFVLGALCGYLYINAQLSSKREMSLAQAPVLGNFGAAMAGLVSIRAYGAQDMFRQESYIRIDKYSRAARSFYVLYQWIAIRVDALAALFTAGLGAYLIYGSNLDPSNVGFSLNMAVQFSGMIIWWIKLCNELQISGNSLERIQQYLSIEEEPKATSTGVPPAYWPASGSLKVERLSARYSPDGPRVLHEISFEVKSGERVGIVGRTGSGKSSLTLALLRCILTEGKVYYDGISTDSLNLDALRSKITIIPQSPELLSGTLRENLDPFHEHDDAVLNDALRAAGLFSLQNGMDDGQITLDSQIASGGGNLSVGQRQILALARAIVRQSKLLILDEATSAIDYETDTVIQASLRGELKKDITLLTIAHRLQTIMDSDKIMVLDAGHIVEYGAPSELLRNENGLLRSLVNESADKERLLALAAGQAGSATSESST
ncbi:hypothetical protein DAEQUDRAFT_727082 [Daedalea quercina L-15889]|uniref:P-loop containing nucleoside triphosphate hydrolase protein n=1 Tax=Daedalea quercina L-15889 TaxID=1314783 RepID=A0A165Q9P3_9APHY|nr:hypothetical protein DAEQUDRAFT_727082 [Daedalea quercina L-15889]